MQLPQWLARFNRHVTNPIQRLWAGWAPTMGILHHVGRRSGKSYRSGTLRRHGRSLPVTNPRVMSKAEAAPHVTGWMRPLFTLLPFEQAVLLTSGDATGP